MHRYWFRSRVFTRAVGTLRHGTIGIYGIRVPTKSVEAPSIRIYGVSLNNTITPLCTSADTANSKVIQRNGVRRNDTHRAYNRSNGVKRTVVSMSTEATMEDFVDGTMENNNNDNDDNQPKAQPQQDGFVIEMDNDTGFLHVYTPFSEVLQDAIGSRSLRNKNSNHTKGNTNANDEPTNKDEHRTNAAPSSTNIHSEHTPHNHKHKPQPTEISEAALHYERQLRKVQAAQRASQPDPSLTDTIDLLHLDDDIVVVNKPSGLLSVPGLNHNPSMLSLVYSRYPPLPTTNGSDGLSAKNDPDKDCLGTSANGNKNNNKNKNNHNRKKGSKQITNMQMEHMAVHRLDMDTSGILVFARNRRSMSHLQNSFRIKTNPKLTPSTTVTTATTTTTNNNNNNKQNTDPNNHLSKTYEALVVGHIHPHVRYGRVSLPLQRDHRNPPFMRVASERSETEARNAVKDLRHAGWKKLVVKKAKESVTEFRVLNREWLNDDGADVDDDDGTSSTNDDDDKDRNANVEQPRWSRRRLPVTRLELTPITGRTHQLRVHCAALGHPIVGDPAYGILGEASAYGGINLGNDNGHTEGDGCGDRDRDGGAVVDNNGFLKTRPSVALQREIDTWVRDGKGGRRKVMCLHARELGLVHPVSGERIVFECAPVF